MKSKTVAEYDDKDKILPISTCDGHIANDISDNIIEKLLVEKMNYSEARGKEVRIALLRSLNEKEVFTESEGSYNEWPDHLNFLEVGSFWIDET